MLPLLMVLLLLTVMLSLFSDVVVASFNDAVDDDDVRTILLFTRIQYVL